MGNLATVLKLSFTLLPCILDYVSAEDEQKVCIEKLHGCVKCRGTSCARCEALLHRGTCVDRCPSGHVADWSTHDEYMGRICRETGYMFGLSGSQFAILIGVISGATICIFIILCGAIVVHRRKKKAAKMLQQYEDSAERREFLKHLATLRGERYTFLSMLNDTRRQVRELHYSGNNGDGAVGIQAYKPVLRDLARILVLVNRRDEEIAVPPDDWQRLLAWAERLLRRYKRHSSPEVAQLVTFLQQPSGTIQGVSPKPLTQPSPSLEARSTPSNLTTFQSSAPLATFQASDKSSISPASSSLGYSKESPIGSSLDQNNISVYNEKLSPNGSSVGQCTPLVYVTEKRLTSSSTGLQELEVPSNLNSCLEDAPEGSPQWDFDTTIDITNYTILSDWSPTREYLIDDFTILGFRPQDEITTEL